jgi:hypothetical protein
MWPARSCRPRKEAGGPSFAKTEFATDSPLEGTGFELPVPWEPLPGAKRYAPVYSGEKAALEGEKPAMATDDAR